MGHGRQPVYNPAKFAGRTQKLPGTCAGPVDTFHLVLEAASAEQAIKNALKESVNFENYEGLVKRATESGVITEEQATMVRLAQQASAMVIAVDEFPNERAKSVASPAGIEKTAEPMESSTELEQGQEQEQEA